MEAGRTDRPPRQGRGAQHRRRRARRRRRRRTPAPGQPPHVALAKKGDVDKGLRQAKVTHEATYSTQVHTHSALETHSLVVRWDTPTTMTAWCSTQGIFSVRDELAEIFALKPQDVRVITEFLGGGFGAKFGASAPGSRLGFIAGELARQASAPVALLLDRREEHLCTGNRPDSMQQVTLGATADGTLTAIKVLAHGSAGIGTGAGVGRNAFGIYSRCPNIRVASHDVFTHAGPATAFRAPGHPQGAFAIELALDELAAKLGKDPLDLRLAHNEHPVRRHQFELGRQQFRWDERRKRAVDQRQRGTRMRRGVGVAASIWGDFGRGKAVVATVSVGRDGSVEVKNGLQDIGGGITTVMAQVVAEVLHRPLADGPRAHRRQRPRPRRRQRRQHDHRVRHPRRARRRGGRQAASSMQLASKHSAANQDALGQPRRAPRRRHQRSLSFAELCKHIDGEAIVATGTRPDTYGAYPMKFMGGNSYQIAGVQFAEVEVDTWTGLVRATEVLALHDCGRVMNELTCRSQISGGIILGTSYASASSASWTRVRGVMLNPNLDSYKIAGALDIPHIDVVFTEVHTGANNTGAIGIGEPATIPTAAAIAAPSSAPSAPPSAASPSPPTASSRPSAQDDHAPLRPHPPRDPRRRPRTRARATQARSFRAGGVDLLDRIKEGLDTPDELVELRHLADVPGSRDINTNPQGALELGALVTLAELAARDDLDAVLREAAGSAATPGIRNLATLGGNLLQRPRCWYYRSADLMCLKKGGDACLAITGENKYHAILGGGPSFIVHPSTLATALLALDASVEIAGDTPRTIPIADLFVTPKQDPRREHNLAPGELVLKLHIPAATPRRSSAYAVAKEKQSHDWPLAEAAVSLSLETGVMKQVRVVLGHVAPTPWRSREAEAVLVGPKALPRALPKSRRRRPHPREAAAPQRLQDPLAQGLLREALHRATNIPLPE
jgi:xanthine dehydrogenase YagR molybdenum-binding subunit